MPLMLSVSILRKHNYVLVFTSLIKLRHKDAIRAITLVLLVKSKVSANVAARILEICSSNNVAQRLKSGLRSRLKVRLRCAHHPRSRFRYRYH